MDLSEFGLSKNEEKVFKTLIEHGRLSANLASRYSRTSYGKIYEILASLENKGLVRVVPEKTKIFVPTNPSELLKLLDEKQNRIDQLREDVKNLKKIYDDNPEDAVVITRGEHNFPKVLREMKNPATFSYGSKYNFRADPENIRRYKEAKAKKVDYKSMGKITTDNLDNIKKWKKAGQKIKKLPGIDNVAVGINDFEVLIVLVKKNTIMLIRDESFVALMKLFYENTYDLLEEFKF